MNSSLQTDSAKPRPKQSLGGSEPAPNLWWLLATIVVVALSCFAFPRNTMTQLPDPSWEGVMIYAREKGLQFGHDIVFTYGPLGFLSIDSFSPSFAVTRIFFEVAIGFAIATGLCLMAWRIALPWRFLLLGFFVFVTAPLHWGGGALFIDLGLFVWGLLCFLESSTRLHVSALVLIVLVAIGALIKFTFLVTGLFTIVLLACDLVLRGRRALAAGIVIGSVLAFVLGWILLGQSLSGIGAFLSASYGVADGYNQAMGLHFGNVVLIMVMAAATLAAAAIRSMSIFIAAPELHALRRGLLLVWLTGLLFLNWKYICVRADYYHLKLLFGFMPLVALCMEALPATARRAVFWSRAASLLCLFAAVIIIRSQIHHRFFPFECFKQTYRDLSGNLGVLLSPARFLREKTEAFDAAQKREQLPKIRAIVGHSTVDVFGQNQACAFANEFNYKPRPVFQSYAAYSRQLMARNEQFYLSQDAPEYVLFNLEPIDGRFPSLEDAFVLRDLLINYQLAFNEGDFLLFQRRRTTNVQLILIKQGSVRVGEQINLSSEHDSNLWLEIDLQPTLPGRLWQFLYKPQEAKLVARRQSETGPASKFHAPAAMLSAGFLASPMVMENKDVMKLYAGEQLSKPDSYSVELAPVLVNVWQPQIRYRIYRVENKLGADSF